MIYNWFEHSPAPSKIILTLALMTTCLMIGIVLSIIIAMPITGLSITEIVNISANATSPSHIAILKYLQTIQSIAFFIIPPFILAPLFGFTVANYLTLNKRPQFSAIVLAGMIILAAIPFVNYTEAFNSRLSLPQAFSGLESWMKSTEQNAMRVTELFLNVKSTPALLFNIFMMAMLPALGEEFVFRGVFQRLFTEWFKNPHWGIIATAALFSAFHLQFYGFIPRMILGMVLGYLFLWSGSIWVPIIAHFINNALGVVVYYLMNQGVLNKGIETVGATNDGWIWASISLIAVTILMALMNKRMAAREMNS